MQNTDLIVLNITKFKDNAFILHTLTRGYGRKSFIVRPGRKAGMAMFLPMNILEAEIEENKNASLWKAHSFNSKYALNGIRNNIYKNSMTMFMSEVLFRAIKEGGEEEGLFDWCIGAVLKLESMRENFSNYHLRFLLELCVSLGFAPDAEHMMPYAGEMMDKIKGLIELPFDESMQMKLSGSERNEIAEKILEYLSYNLDYHLNIKSLTVLREFYS